MTPFDALAAPVRSSTASRCLSKLICLRGPGYHPRQKYGKNGSVSAGLRALSTPSCSFTIFLTSDSPMPVKAPPTVAFCGFRWGCPTFPLGARVHP